MRNTTTQYPILNTQYFVLVALYFVLYTSCKVNYGFSGATIPPEAKTINIKYFSNQSTLAPPTYSQQFTEALKDYFITQSGLKLTDRGGDLIFDGTISNYVTSPVAIQGNDQAALTRLTITVSVRYTNSFDEKKNFESTFSRFADFPNSKTLRDVEAELTKEINKQLVDDIYNKAFNNW